MVYLIGIAGGSGSGKSTLAYGLHDLFPELMEVVHFDDYQKPKEQVLLFQGMINWDCPEAIDLDQLYKDLLRLKTGNEVKVMTKSERHNPRYHQQGRIPLVMKPKPLILVEGYLAFHDPRVRELFTYKIFLDLSPQERFQRRTKKNADGYADKVLRPMHEKYVEPTRRYADLVVEVSRYTREEIKEMVVEKLKALFPDGFGYL